MLRNPYIFWPDAECTDIEAVRTDESLFSLFQNPEIRQPGYHCNSILYGLILGHSTITQPHPIVYWRVPACPYIMQSAVGYL